MPCSSDNGTVFWITGLSAAGKTTVARALCKRLRDLGRPVVHLDGDEMRKVLGVRAAYDRASRLELSRTYSEMCSLFAAQGNDVVCSTVSLFHEIHEKNRQEIDNYVEVVLTAPVDTLAARDVKGIYAAGGRDGPTNMVGLDIAAEWPLNPDLVIENTSGVSLDEIVERILPLGIAGATS